MRRELFGTKLLGDIMENKGKKEPTGAEANVDSKLQANLQLEVIGNPESHPGFVMALKDSYSEEIEGVESDAFGKMVMGVSESLTLRTRTPIGLLTHLIANISDIVEGANGLYVRPTLIFQSNLVSPGAAVFCESPLSEEIIAEVHIVAREFLNKLRRKSHEGHTLFSKATVKKNAESLYEAALEKTLEEVGGKNLSHKVLLLGSQGETLSTLDGVLRRSDPGLPPVPGEPTKYEGILMGHDIGRRKIILEVDKRRVEIDADFEELHDYIVGVLHVLRANVVAEVSERKKDNQIVGIDLRKIALGKSNIETKECTTPAGSLVDQYKPGPLGF